MNSSDLTNPVGHSGPKTATSSTAAGAAGPGCGPGCHALLTLAVGEPA